MTETISTRWYHCTSAADARSLAEAWAEAEPRIERYGVEAVEEVAPRAYDVAVEIVWATR